MQKSKKENGASGMLTGRSQVKQVVDPKDVKKDAARAIMIDLNFELNQNILGIVERLAARIPFEKIDIENLQLDQKDDQTDNCPEGTMKDTDYNYCYKNLLIETKEWYTKLQHLTVYLSGKQLPEKSAKQPVSKDKGAVQDKDAPPPRCVELKKTVDAKTKLQDYKVLNFSSEANMGEFMVFLAEYMAFTEKQIHLTILIGDIVEQSIRHTNMEQFELNIKNDQDLEVFLLDDQSKKAAQGQQVDTEPSPERNPPKIQKKGINASYKFMSIDQLEHFKEQYFKSVGQLTLRMYKSVYAIYKLYPNFNTFEQLSIFDKVYQLQVITHSFSQYQFDNLQELQRMQLPHLFDFEHQAQLLLKDGGIKNKDLEVIQETSKVIRDQIDSKLEYAYNTHEISPDFFISSKEFSEIWNGSIINDYKKSDKFKFKVGLDVIKMAYQKHLGGNTDGALTDESFNLFKSFLPIETEAITNYQKVKFVDLVNFSDFIEFHTILNIYCQDQVNECLDQIKNEKTIIQDLYNQNFSNQKTQSSGGFVAAGSSKMCFDPEGQAQNINGIDKMLTEQNSSFLDQNVFLRTPRLLENGDWDLLYFLSLFGVKHILNSEMQYGIYMKERLESELLLACERDDQVKLSKYQKQIDLIERKTADYKTQMPPVVSEETILTEKIESIESGEEPELQPLLSDDVLSADANMTPATNGANIEKTISSPRKYQKNLTVAPKRVQIVTTESQDQTPAIPKRSQTMVNKKIRRSSTLSNGSNVDNNFMKDLDYEGCYLMGLDSVLQVNEVYENFAEITAQTTSMDEDGFNNEARKASKSKQGASGFLDVLDQHPELQLASHHEQQSLNRHNNILDVITRTLQNKRKRIEHQLKNQIGETLGNFDKIKEDEEYEGYAKLDRGYLLQFHSPNEAKFISKNFIFQKIMQGSHFLTMEPGESISTISRMHKDYPQKPPPKDAFDEWGFQKHTDRAKAYLPVCIPFRQLIVKSGRAEHIRNQKILEYYIFRDLSTVLQRDHIKRIIKNPLDFRQELRMPPPDLNILKKYVLRHQKLHFYKRKEMHQRVKQFKVRQIVGKRFYDIFTKLSAISTDGFQREQHVIKIQHWSDEVTKAQLDLQKEEQLVESGALATQDAQNLSESIQRITTLMINIERWTAQKQQMEETLKAEEQDWIQNDTIYKQRRIILNYIIKLNLDMVYDTHAYLSLSHSQECNRNLSGQAYDLIFFMIQHILCQNRMPSINFMAEINQFINSQQEEMSQLNNTQFELTSKVLAIEEEKREMRKKIDEMKGICDLKEAKETLVIDINNLDMKVSQLKKLLGKGPAPMPEQKEKV